VYTCTVNGVSLITEGPSVVAVAAAAAAAALLENTVVHNTGELQHSRLAGV